MKITISRSDTDDAIAPKEMLVTDFGQPLTIVQASSSRLVDDLYCLVPKTTKIAMEPTLPSNTLMRMAMLGMIDQFEKKGFCARYRRCGSQYASVSFLGEKRAAYFDQLFTHFRADDSTTSSLTVRPMRSSQMDEYIGNVSQECLPAT